MGMRSIFSALKRKVGGQYHGWRVVAATFGVNAVHDGTYSLRWTRKFGQVAKRESCS
jgi:hypothetical protein